MRGGVLFYFTCLLLRFADLSEFMALPEWPAYPSNTCPNIVRFLADKCNERPRVWIPFMFVNASRVQKIQCVQCRHRRKLEAVCAHDPHRLWALSFFDTRACLTL